MSARSSIDRSPHREEIIEAMANGVPGVEIARLYGVSKSAISRYKYSHSDILTAIIEDDELAPTEIFGRLADLADSARLATKLASTSQSVTVRTRAITAELSVLDRLTKLNIHDTTTARLAESVGPLVQSIQILSKENLQPVLDALAKFPALDELRESLKISFRAKDGNND